jgi:hypothetical protein
MNSLIVATLLAGVAPSASPSSLAWQSDYTHARELASQQQKPLAVFVGSGSEGWSQVVRNGSVDGQTLEALSKSYICLYADRTTESGAQMASALQVSTATGLVISDRTGKVQAFSHDGVMSTSDLQRTVEKFSDATRVVTSTETMTPPGLLQVSYSVAPSTNLGTVPPGTVVISQNGMYVQAPAKYDAVPQASVPGNPAPVQYFPSSCPNGRCGTPTTTYSSCPNGRCPK